MREPRRRCSETRADRLHRPDSRYAPTNRERRRHKISVTTLFLVVRWGSAAPRAGGRLPAAVGCAERTIRRSPVVKTIQSTRLPQPWRTSSPTPYESSSAAASRRSACASSGKCSRPPRAVALLLREVEAVVATGTFHLGDQACRRGKRGRVGLVRAVRLARPRVAQTRRPRARSFRRCG